jgi:putative proteasome-type protease
MTYCVGVQVDEGLVFLSDSRTNAGVDHVSTFRKMTFFEMPGERVIVLLSSGNLAVSQSVTGLLRDRVTSAKASLLTTRTMPMRPGSWVTRCATYSIEMPARSRASVTHVHHWRQIGGEAHRLFHVYSAGNFIETTADTRYFQIGEAKYGKPIIDPW